MARTFLLPLFAAAVCALGSFAAAATPAAASTRSAPAEGIFEDCPLATDMTTCTARLATIHAGGFNVVVVPIEFDSPQTLEQYATAAHALGMSVMWDIANAWWWQDPMTATNMGAGYYADFAQLCGCSENGPVLDYLVKFLANLPATYGYYAADDSMIGPGDAAGMRTYVAHIKRADPNDTVMISAFQPSQAHQYMGIADVVGQEVYPDTAWDLLPMADSLDVWDSVASTITQTQHEADSAGKQSAFILQAFSWGDNLADGTAMGVCSPGDSRQRCWSEARYPSGAEQLQLRNEVLAHADPKLILWWSFQGTYGPADGQSPNFTPPKWQEQTHWAGLTAAVRAPIPGATQSASADRKARHRSTRHRHTKHRHTRHRHTRHRHTRHRHRRYRHRKHRHRRAT